ncbi:MAG: phosphoribosyltransferase family protein [Pseudolysinimonas sp.]
MNLRAALLDALALLSPVECAGCGADDRSLCADCRGALAADVTQRFTGGLRVHSALEYGGRARRVILAFKEQERTDVAAALALPFAAALRAALAAAALGAELALVPTSRAAWRRRGYDPVLTLVRRAGGAPSRVLLPARASRAQKSLGLAARAANRSGAFVAARPLTSRRFVIVDDILTSGATLEEAARAVSAAGGEVVGGATLAFTTRLLAFRDIGAEQDYGGRKGASD